MMVPPPLLPVVIVVGTGDRCANQACRHGGSGETPAPIDRASRLVRLFEHPSSSPMQHLRKSILHCGGHKKFARSRFPHTRDQLVVVGEKALWR
jgi:hypothetical protein